MKRLLSVLLAAVMMLACATPVFSTDISEIPGGRVFTIDVFAEDAAIDESTNTVDVYFDLANNLGVLDLNFNIVYPKCLTLTGYEIVYEMAEGYSASIGNYLEETTDPYAFYRAIEALDIDACAILGCDPDELALCMNDPANYPWQNIETENKFVYVMFTSHKTGDNTAFAKENGRFLKLSFSYDPALNTASESELPVNMFPYKPVEDAPAVRDPYAYPYYNYRFYGANIEVPSLSGNCEHEFAVAVTEPESCLSLGYKTYTCTKCGETKDIMYYMGHSFTAVNTATCTQWGEKYEVCETCGVYYAFSDWVDALGHDFEEEFTVDVKPTTTRTGQKSRHCTRCDAVTDVTVIPKLMKIDDLFTDGRTMTPERAAQLLDMIGLNCTTGSTGDKYVWFYHNVYSSVVIDDIDAFYADPDALDNLAESMGLNSDYFYLDIERDIALSDLNVYRVYINMTAEARELIGFQDMSNIERLYLELLIITGGNQFGIEPVLGGGDNYVGTEGFYGDVNLDGKVNGRDFMYLKKYLAGSVWAINLAAADQNGDGKINGRDLQQIKKKIAGAE